MHPVIEIYAWGEACIHADIGRTDAHMSRITKHFSCVCVCVCECLYIDVMFSHKYA
jgi:hypothetical protein